MHAPPSARPILAPEAHDARLTDPSRLAALRATGLLDGAASPVLDRLARLASTLLKVPVSAISLVDDMGQHFAGLTGLGGWAGERRGTPLSHSFCQHVVAGDAPLIVSDSRRDPLVSDNLAVPALSVIAYAGVPLRTSDGHVLGAFCAIDTSPRTWTDEQVAVLHDLAAAAMAEIELRATTHALLQSQEKLLQQAMRDPLTGLLNRRGFADVARQHLAAAQRLQHPVCTVALDLDGFKSINDTFGHDAGDEALVELAALLTATARESDAVARLGGDEFLVMLVDTDQVGAERFASRLRDQLDALNASAGFEFTLASSIGIGCWTPEHPLTLNELLRDADTALYADKRARKAGIV